MRNPSAERVLVFGGDTRAFLAVVRSLGRAGKEVHVVPVGRDSPALKSKYITAIHRLPCYSENPAAWRKSALELFAAHRFDLIIPLCEDRSVLPFDVHRREFTEFPIVVPNPAVMNLLFDKERTRALCSELGIPIVHGAPIDSSDTATSLVERFGLPLVLKPKRSHWIDQLHFRWQVSILQSHFDAARLLGGIKERSRYLAEAYFEGVGVGISVLAQNGEILHAFQHRRLREGDAGSSYRISEPVNTDLLDACQKICRRTDLTGVCMFEFRRNDKTGGWVLLETNARFWGSLPLPVALGVDFPLYLYDLLVHERRHAPHDYAEGITCRNLVGDGFILAGRIRHLRCDQWPMAGIAGYLFQPLRWMTGRERSDTFVSDDLTPALQELLELPSSVLRQLVRRRATR